MMELNAFRISFLLVSSIQLETLRELRNAINGPRFSRLNSKAILRLANYSRLGCTEERSYGLRGYKATISHLPSHKA
jgi:hypothetical protein